MSLPSFLLLGNAELIIYLCRDALRLQGTMDFSSKGPSLPNFLLNSKRAII